MVPVRTAMLLAAGLGLRMRPLTEHTPKPLLSLGDRTLLDHMLDRLAESGVTSVVVNAHWQAGQIAAHLAARHGIDFFGFANPLRQQVNFRQIFDSAKR